MIKNFIGERIMAKMQKDDQPDPEEVRRILAEVNQFKKLYMFPRETRAKFFFKSQKKVCSY